MMEQLTNYKHKIDFLLSDNMHLCQPAQTTVKKNRKTYKKCNECNKRRLFFEGHQICRMCYKSKIVFKSSGNKVIDDFIKYTQTNFVFESGKMEFVPYDQFINIEFIAEGGFSKIYKAIWVDGPINWHNIINNNCKISRFNNYTNYTVVLKKLHNSKNITSKELNELKVFYQIYSDRKSYNGNISKYFGITQDPITKDIMIIMPYYDSGDLIRYISNRFYDINWNEKLSTLCGLIKGLENIHNSDIIHRDLHSGNVFIGRVSYNYNVKGTYVGDLGISKSATESGDDNENYGIIPYMAPEIFQGKKYTKASDIYSFGMIMWEIMTGRRPFWDRNHDTYLIIDICDGLRPPIVTNAPEGFIELMKECWHSDPEKRPTVTDIYDKINKMRKNEGKSYTTKIIKSSDIGPVPTNHSGAIYKSRPLSSMINSAMSLRSSKSLSINLGSGKRKFKDLVTDNDDDDQWIKKEKLCENEINEYLTN